MKWLKQISPIVLHQSSELPYVILEDGVHLCFNNIYSELTEDFEHTISFNANRHDLSRRSTHYYRFKEFPIVIPFQHVIKLDKVIADGRIIKHTPETTDETSSAIVVKSSYLKSLSEEQFDELIERIESVEYCFVLVGKNVENQAHLLENLSTFIYHSDSDWGRTCVTIADALCPISDRKYCWTQAVPETELYCYGLKEPKNMEKLHNTLDDIGLTQCSAIWSDFSLPDEE